MPDAWIPGGNPLDARLALGGALRELTRVQRSELPRDLQEVVAARKLVELAKELEAETVRVARGQRDSEGRLPVRTVTGAVRSPRRHSWAAIGAALGITPQSAHERWAKRITN